MAKAKRQTQAEVMASVVNDLRQIIVRERAKTGALKLTWRQRELLSEFNEYWPNVDKALDEYSHDPKFLRIVIAMWHAFFAAATLATGATSTIEDGDVDDVDLLKLQLDGGIEALQEALGKLPKEELTGSRKVLKEKPKKSLGKKEETGN